MIIATTKDMLSLGLLQLVRHQPTLGMQEMKSLSNVPDNLTGLQLIKVLSVLDMCENGA